MENIANNETRSPSAAGSQSWLAALGAFLSGALFLAAFLLPNGKQSEIIIYSLSPLALLPAVSVLYRLFRQEAPELSRLALAAGVLGIAPSTAGLLIVGLFRLVGAAELSAGWSGGMQNLLSGFTMLAGLWMAITGHLGGTTRLFPTGLATVALVAGITRILVTANLVLSTVSSYPQVTESGLWNLALLLWIASHVIFTAWLGLWLLARHIKLSPAL